MVADMDTNIWGLICVPLGILICFGPALFVAAFGKNEEPARQKVERKNH
ncbi:MAG: hypothetical protein JWM68_723 [Verrucomicrobiales bacterium]|nr:hypothetical protein [Verrucomicrobiales bacterium]